MTIKSGRQQHTTTMNTIGIGIGDDDDAAAASAGNDAFTYLIGDVRKTPVPQL